MSVLWLFLAIAALLLLRVPVAFAFLGPSLAYMWITGQSIGASLRLLTPADRSFPLLAVPLFILLGVIANRGGIADRLFDFALACLGRVRGSLGYVSVGVSLGFSWMSGSAVADAAALGKIQIPAMQRNGYPTKFALGVDGRRVAHRPRHAAQHPGGHLRRPGRRLDRSAVRGLGRAGPADGGGSVHRRVPAGAPVPRHPDDAVLQEAGAGDRPRVIGPLGAPVIILGGILSGAFTPTEAAAVGVAYMLLLCFFYRSLKLRDLPAVLAETVATSAAIMLIVSSAALLGYVMARERVPQMISEAIFSLTDNSTVFLLLVAIVMLILGTAIDPTAILVLTVPIILPISDQFGVDPIALGVLMIIVDDDRAAHAAGRHGPLRAERDHEGADRRRSSSARSRSWSRCW